MSNKKNKIFKIHETASRNFKRILNSSHFNRNLQQSTSIAKTIVAANQFKSGKLRNNVITNKIWFTVSISRFFFSVVIFLINCVVCSRDILVCSYLFLNFSSNISWKLIKCIIYYVTGTFGANYPFFVIFIQYNCYVNFITINMHVSVLINSFALVKLNSYKILTKTVFIYSMHVKDLLSMKYLMNWSINENVLNIFDKHLNLILLAGKYQSMLTLSL